MIRANGNYRMKPRLSRWRATNDVSPNYRQTKVVWKSNDLKMAILKLKSTPNWSMRSNYLRFCGQKMLVRRFAGFAHNKRCVQFLTSKSEPVCGSIQTRFGRSSAIDGRCAVGVDSV